MEVKRAGAAVFILFPSGGMWSVVPVGDNTLPHRIEATLGASFKWSTPLSSSVLGMLRVGEKGLFEIFRLILDEGHAGEYPVY